ncbi:MAG: ferredoxin [Nocardioidaceae bacterium]|jgi:ferredoxin|nr:ferredoxin [Nocardioidaceae bacterium]
MRVVVDAQLCETNSICMGLAPDVFEVGEDDTVTVLLENPPESLRKDVENAVRLCPRSAITLLDG